ncbi:hypothetical protein KQI42_10725 [Tissierella sp. MSJ-40]|uniref:Lipoprotein n=1 Tax=Tissierella simiarum TaxID=2841534 RepID=A0ABS6E7F7_9FIRM|nr:hypothetical protein [Tissierella simiarum]MBU5438486.1 hypothetical protein [Tissierella simiarum]
MKRILFFLVITSLIIIVAGCGSSDQKPFLAVESKENIEQELINYEVEKIVLSKGFQSIEPNVEVLKKTNKIKLLTSLGLVESSGVTINKIVKDGKQIDIYVNSLFEEDKLQLAVPQVVIELKDSQLGKIEDMKFNIINENYKPINIKFGKNQVLNKIYSHFKISTNSIPTVNLTRLKDKVLWNISFNTIFDKQSSKAPLVNLSVQIDANTGDIIKSEKNIVSNYIDEGNILDYVPGNSLLYKRTQEVEGKIMDSLWSYDTKSKEITNIYTSKDKISSAAFSPDLKFISIIETDGNLSDLYIIPSSDKRAYRVTSENPINPKTMMWKNGNTLFLINNNEDNSNIYSYNVDKNESQLVATLNMNIENLQIHDDNFLVVEGEENEVNKKISITKNWQDFKFKDSGFNPKFIDKNKIAYLKNKESEDKNLLYIYDVNTSKIYDILDYNVSNFLTISNKSLIFVEKNTCNNDYTLYSYEYNNKEVQSIAKINGDKIYYDSNNNLIYITLIPPFENEKAEIIYSLDLNKLK